MSSPRIESDETSSKNATGIGIVFPLDANDLAARYRPFLKALAATEVLENRHTRCDDSDLVQQTLLRAAKHADQFRGNTSQELESWLAEMLRDQVRDAVNSDGRKQKEVGSQIAIAMFKAEKPGLAASDDLGAKESRDLIWRAVSALPDDYRKVILLRQQNNLRSEEIAKQMNHSPDVVRMLWARAVVALGDKLKSLR